VDVVFFIPTHIPPLLLLCWCCDCCLGVQKFSTCSIRKGEDMASDVKTEFKIGKVDTEIKVDTKNKVRTYSTRPAVLYLQYFTYSTRPTVLHLQYETHSTVRCRSL